ncbi:helix-turn-helix domain-containing protein [Streptomyces sp. XD-27]|uniref:helix-turn-helix domain-containing protein n=1 Tax=Streptomyces sp. XD-27 TaxID=3062779 RepID=UPI0026F45CA8|nr:helix-turn-helix domain-containing protein [Streptomyces sp. XD-27]WKX69413.1 helix-turn-helix domain-containing protein [Streptomyces sp. XD-27]
MPHTAPPAITATAASSELLAGDTYSTNELARLLKVDPSRVRRWRTVKPPQCPPFIVMSGRHILYSAIDVQQWLTDRRVEPAKAA